MYHQQQSRVLRVIRVPLTAVSYLVDNTCTTRSGIGISAQSQAGAIRSSGRPLAATEPSWNERRSDIRSDSNKCLLIDEIGHLRSPTRVITPALIGHKCQALRLADQSPANHIEGTVMLHISVDYCQTERELKNSVGVMMKFFTTLLIFKCFMINVLACCVLLA